MWGDLIIALIVGLLSYMALTVVVEVVSDIDKRRKK